MGIMHHHAIVVTSWQSEGIEAAHFLAESVFPWVSPISPETVNGYRSFFVPPDGSKEGWDASERGDYRRSMFIEGLENLFVKGLYTHWVEVGFGEFGYEIERTSENMEGE